MISYVRNIIIIVCLHLAIIWTSEGQESLSRLETEGNGGWSAWGPWSSCNSQTGVKIRGRRCNKPQAFLAKRDVTCPGSFIDQDSCPVFEYEPVDTEDPDVATMQKLTEELGATFTVSCVQDARNMRRLVDAGQSQLQVCGAGRTCSNDVCGTGAHPVIKNTIKKPSIESFKHLSSKPSGCKHYSPFCQPYGWLDFFCFLHINSGTNCPGLYDEIHGICWNFCGNCPSTFNACKCDCCHCLGVGGACNPGECDNYNCG